MASEVKEPAGPNKVQHAIERNLFGAVIRKILKELRNTDDKTKIYLKLLNLATPFFGKEKYKDTLNRIRTAMENPDHRWMKFISSTIDNMDPHVAETLFMNVGYEEFLRGTATIRKNRKKYKTNIPYVVLFDPTSACNMHCEGCWSGTYGHKDNLSYDDMNKIVTESKALGDHMFLLTGGEPMVRKKDVFKLAKEHNDCEFGIFTNSTFIDEEVCKECVSLGNIIFFLSIEGTEATNDARRGDGHYQTVLKAMDLLHKHGLLYATSICYTKYNIDAVTSDAFFKLLEDKGASFGFYFHYMPVGNNAVTDLLPTPEQRKYMIDRIRYIRSPECNVQFFPMDFQNDGEFIGGCIAGGREYFHINAHGDAEPCVFIHFSDRNIHSSTILEMLQSPLFMAYREGQPFNDNHLRPCPMLENPEMLRGIIKKTGAKDTNQESDESVEHLTAKCDEYAKEWKPVADDYWANHHHWKASYKDTDKDHVVYDDNGVEPETAAQAK